MSEKSNEFTPIGFVLFENEEFDWNFFKKTLDKTYGIKTKETERDNSMIIDIDGTMMIVSLMPAPVPNGEAEENAKHNYLWRDGVEQVSKHKSHVILTMMPYADNYELFIKFATCLLKCPGSIGIYTNGTVYQSEFYIDHAEMLNDGELPTPIMIYIGLYQNESGTCGYTYGLENFGYREIEIINSKMSLGDLYEFFFSVSRYVLEYKVTLNDGETIGFTEEQKLPITLSKGVAIDGDTLKIEY